MKMGKMLMQKTKMRMKKFGRIWFLNFSCLHDIIHENLRRKNLTHFVRHLWLIEAKIKMKIKRFGKTSSIFEFSISKFHYTKIFVKISEKKILTNFLSHFWLIEAKRKMKMKKFGKTSLIFEFSIIKLRYVVNFMKVREKSFWPIF